MSLLIAGDFVPYNGDIIAIRNGDISNILNGELLDIWNKSETKIFNLEAPIINKGKAIMKNGPTLKIDENCIKGIKELNPSLICLANNHIRDYGDEGIRNTISLLKKNDIKYIGVGSNCNNLKKYEIITIDNKKVAIYNTCEHEFSIATDDHSGAFGFDEGVIFKDLINLKKICDYIVIIYHGGKEYYRYPSPNLQKRCRYLSDFGADLIICQHSHCIGCFEKYNKSYIIYGQGNFIFNKKNDEYWNSSLIINASFHNKINLEFIPIVRLEKGIKIPDTKEAQKILKLFYERSDKIISTHFVKKEYNKYSKNMINNYLTLIHGNNFFIRVISKITNKRVFQFIYNKHRRIIIQNIIDCEAHRELFIDGLKELNNDEN